MTMKHGSLFSGIGGFDLAAEWMGWENVFHCEWNPFGQKVLKHYWPNSISYNDITKTDFTIHRGAIDILTGGFPCQPYSSAGKRLGKEDERHLWPEMLRAIREIQPRWIVGENVLGLVNWNGGMVFEEVQANLEAEGYEVQPYVLPAAAVGSCPHRRDRVWFVAYNNGINGFGKKRELVTQQEHRRFVSEVQGTISEGIATNTKNSGCGGRACKECADRRERLLSGKCERCKMGSKIEGCGGKRATMHTNRTSEQGEHIGQKREGKFNGPDSRNGIGDWDNFPTVSPICFRNDGLSSRLDGITFSKWRNESIKAAGNAIVPQVVYQIFKAIHIFETQNLKP
jgi:DNA (cytosine-5)-methyltransferase 1